MNLCSGEAPLKAELLCRGLLFGRDFKAHLEAAELLAASLPAEMPAVVAGLDLLLTWICARICDANMSCLLKVLALTRSLLLQLREQVQGPGSGFPSLSLSLPLLCCVQIRCGCVCAYRNGRTLPVSYMVHCSCRAFEAGHCFLA